MTTDFPKHVIIEDLDKDRLTFQLGREQTVTVFCTPRELNSPRMVIRTTLLELQAVVAWLQDQANHH